MKLVLLGFRATGKSLIGKLLAQEFGLPFIDLDCFISERAGQSIARIVAQEGWPKFRALEREALRALLHKPAPFVLALGGGAVMHKEEMAALKKQAFMIWLVAQPETILKRLTKDQKTSAQRPSLTGKPLEKEIEEVLAQREPLYRDLAHLVVETDQRSPREVVAEIKKHLPVSGEIGRV